MHKIFSTNPYVDCHYYAESGKCALVNNLAVAQETVFLNAHGRAENISLAPMQTRWIEEKE